jgi:sialidase-1
VQLASGRLIIPANHAEDVAEYHCPYLVDRRRSRMVAHCIYSDDHGKTWCLGGIARRHTNESTLGVLPSGELILNSRDWSGRFQRTIAHSTDDGKSWGPARYDPTLIEPEPQGCQGSMLIVPPPPASASTASAPPPPSDGIVLFCNPSSDRREMLTVRRSDDRGATWRCSFLLEEGAAAYSCLGLTHDGCLGVLYERGNVISFARIPSAHDAPLGVFC